MAIPRASRTASASVGLPLPLEKRTCARTAPPERCGARLSDAASDVGVNVPAHSTPFACTARKPGWTPYVAAHVTTTSHEAVEPGLVQACVFAATVDELAGRAVFDDPAALEHDDAVCDLHRGEAMGDDHRGAIGEQRPQRALHQTLRRD